jgi:hypothetical protein
VVPGRARGPGPAHVTPFLAGLLAAASLVGCTDLRTPSDLVSLIGPPQKRFEGVPAHDAAPADATAPVTTAPPTTVVAAAPPGALRPPLKDVRELVGLQSHELQARLGDPSLRRRDAPAEIWQYRSTLCVLDVFLYRDGQAMRVTTAEVRPRDGRELPAGTCLSSL